MELYQIRYFLELSKHEHIMKTADLLHISQPALSRSLAALEKELGLQLFDRSGKHIHLNHNGEQFAKYAEKALAMLEEGVNAAKDVHYEMTGKIAILNYAYAPLLAACSTSYAKLNPHVSMKISQFSLGRNQRSNENPDFILCSSSEALAVTTDDRYWTKESIYKEEYVLAATDELLPLPADQDSIALEDCRNLPFVVMFHRHIFYQDPTYILCQSLGFFPRILHETDSYDVKADMAANGLAAAILPRTVAERKKTQMPELRIYHLSDVDGFHDIYFLRQKKSLMSETALDFWEYTLDYYNRPKDTRE